MFFLNNNNYRLDWLVERFLLTDRGLSAGNRREDQDRVAIH